MLSTSAEPSADAHAMPSSAALRFPEAIPEKLGLALAKLLEADSGAGARLQTALQAADPQDAATPKA